MCATGGKWGGNERKYGWKGDIRQTWYVTGTPPIDGGPPRKS